MCTSVFKPFYFFCSIAAVIMANKQLFYFRPSMPRDLLEVHSRFHFKQFPPSFRLTQAQTLLTLLKCISLLPAYAASQAFWSPLRVLWSHSLT